MNQIICFILVLIVVFGESRDEEANPGDGLGVKEKLTTLSVLYNDKTAKESTSSSVSENVVQRVEAILPNLASASNLDSEDPIKSTKTNQTTNGSTVINKDITSLGGNLSSQNNSANPAKPQIINQTTNGSTVFIKEIISLGSNLTSLNESTTKAPTTTTTQNPHILFDPLGTKVLLFERNSSGVSEILVPGDPETIKSSKLFDPERPTRIIIHGPFDGLDRSNWMTDMRDRFHKVEDSNIILVDWKKGASISAPDQRLINVRMLGNQLSTILKDLIKFRSLKPEDVHIIAHSVGTFAADVVGQQIKKIGRISGLDPGGPKFDLLPADMRLDKSDALFVDVIHTDAEDTSLSLYGRGTNIKVGHIDFFPNGGFDQPGCTIQRFEDLISRPTGEGIRRFVACHHYRAIDYYLESITSNESSCVMMGYACDNYTSFLEGKCDTCSEGEGQCAEMGFKSVNYKLGAESFKKKLFLQTNRRKSYCLYHQKIEIKLSDKPLQTKGGVLLLHVTGENGTMEARMNGGMNGFKHGNVTKAVVTHSSDIGKVASIRLAWLPAPSINLFTNPRLYIESIKFTPLSIIDSKVRSTFTNVLCNSNGLSITPFYRYTFSVKSSCDTLKEEQL